MENCQHNINNYRLRRIQSRDELVLYDTTNGELRTQEKE